MSQPGLSEDSIIALKVVLDGLNVPSANRTADKAYIFVSAVLSCLNLTESVVGPLVLHVFEELLSIFTVVIVRLHDFLNVVLPCA